MQHHSSVSVFNPACDVKATHWVTHLINICSVFIWQHNTILSLLCLRRKNNNSGMFVIYTYRYARALVEKYFCISQSQESQESQGSLLWQQRRGLQRGFRGEGETKQKMQHSGVEEGLLLHFLDIGVMTECVAMKINVLPETLQEIYWKDKRARRRRKKRNLFPLWSSNLHDKQITLKRNGAFPAQNTKRFTHT